MARKVAILFTLVLSVSMIAPLTAWCDAIQFNVSPTDIGPLKTGEFDLFSSGLTGTILAGQSLSLDLIFGNNVLARVFADTFGITLTLQTDAGTFPGFAELSTGYLLDPNGDAIGSAEDAGSGASSDGSLSVGLPYLSTDASGHVEISGVHMDMVLPNSGYVVTDSTLSFSFYDSDSGARFGTEAQLAEPPTFALVSIGVVGALLGGLFRYRREG